MSKHLGIMNKGLFFSIFTIASIAVRAIAGKLSDRFGRVPVLIVGTLLYSGTMIMAGFAETKIVFYVSGVLFGLAAGITGPTIFAWTIDLADDRFRGRAMATMFIALEAGIGIGGVVSGYSYNNDAANFPISFTLSGLFCFAATIYLLFYRRGLIKAQRDKA
jgi:MFS family permease